MKAVLCKQFGPPESLVIEELPSPKAGAGEVVAVAAIAPIIASGTLVFAWGSPRNRASGY